ncbi:uncharacterized protein MONBRDRAFT_13254, partial [Monosiga brevicollis MX1]
SVTIREISILNKLQHDNIVCLHQLIDAGDMMYLVFEFFERDLSTYFQQIAPNRMDRDLAHSYLHQLFDGLAYCHARLIIHRDIKPQNLLIDELGHIKIADFGLARRVNLPSRPYTPNTQTLWYRAPELLLHSHTYGAAVDLWSMGCLMAEMLTGNSIFMGRDEIDMITRIFRLLGMPTEDEWARAALPSGFRGFNAPRRTMAGIFPALSPEDVELLNQLLTYKPEHRIDAYSASMSPLFERFRC